MKFLHKHIFSLLVLASCIGPPQLQDGFEQYADLAQLVNDQFKLMQDQTLIKTVSLNGVVETQSLEMDTVLWMKELSFLKDIDPAQSEYVGAFDVNDSLGYKQLVLKEGEKGILKSIAYNSTSGILEARVLEEKDIYVYEKDITLQLKEGQLASYKIKGFQKMLLRDTVFFEISGDVK